MTWDKAEEIIYKIGCCVQKYEDTHCPSDNCDECPYHIDRSDVSVEDEIEAYKMATEAIHLRTIRPAVMKITVACPTCGAELDLEQENKICPHCGQWLDSYKEYGESPDFTIPIKGVRGESD